ncbi:MAG: serine/threonine-protein kinase [Tannerellaceae bacterium]
MNLPNGHLLQNGKYRLTHVVGQGGFGITYKGDWSTEVKGSLGTINTDVAICVKEYFFKDYCYRDTDSFAVMVHSETGKALFNKFKEKLIKEARILSEVHHPHIVNVLEVFEENNTAYIAMEYISGYSLKHRMEKEGCLSEAKVLKYIHQIGEALQFVHEKNILHLDIKPSNILIDKDDNARLIDFGVSKRYDVEQQETSTTILTLSKGFASIEQYDNEGTQSFSPCPDIYSLGATMYNLLTGKIPTESILRAARPLQKPSEINPTISAKTEAVIIKAMQIIPSDRFPSVSEMLAALDLPLAEVTEPGKAPQKQVEVKGGDTTLLQPASRSRILSDDDDCTLLNVLSAEVPQEEKKKRLKGILISFLITIFALLGSVIYFVYSNKSHLQKTEQQAVSSLPTELEVVKEQEQPVVSDSISVEKDPVVAKVATENKVSQSQAKLQMLQKPVDTIVEKPKGSDEKVVDAAYTVLLASGKAKMAAADYAGAEKDLREAKNKKLTEEVVRLLISCDEKADEKRLADRKALYEEKMTFGKYKIVRKKSNGRYGAIDANAEERISCKYLSVGKADNGRAFEREDNLFDIYNVEGALISKGITFY